MTCFTFPSKWEKVELSDIAIFRMVMHSKAQHILIQEILLSVSVTYTIQV